MRMGFVPSPVRAPTQPKVTGPFRCNRMGAPTRRSPLYPPAAYLEGCHPSGGSNPEPLSLMKELSAFSANMAALQARGIEVNSDFARRYPNCWGTALFTADTLPSLHHVEEQEFGAWLSSPVYRTITKWQDVRPGDMVALAQKALGSDYLMEVHAAVVVRTADDMRNAIVYSKNGAYYPAQMTTMGEMLDTYASDPTRNGPEVEDVITFHRPGDLNRYLRSHPNQVVSDYLKILSCKHKEALHTLSVEAGAPQQTEEQENLDQLKQTVDRLLKETRDHLLEEGDKGDPLAAAVAHALRVPSSFQGRAGVSSIRDEASA